MHLQEPLATLLKHLGGGGRHEKNEGLGNSSTRRGEKKDTQATISRGGGIHNNCFTSSGAGVFGRRDTRGGGLPAESLFGRPQKKIIGRRGLFYYKISYLCKEEAFCVRLFRETPRREKERVLGGKTRNPGKGGCRGGKKRPPFGFA